MAMKRLFMRLAALMLLGLAPVAQAAAAPEAPTPSSNGGEYVLGPTDVVEVDLLGRTDFTTKDRIAEDGKIRLPLLGEVHAADMTSAQLGDEVAALLVKGGFFTQPIVKVDVVSYGSRYVTLLGNFRTPGLVPIDHPYRLSEIVARAGGVSEAGADYVVYRPVRGEERKIRIEELATGEGSLDPQVAPGDKIYAPPADLAFISGQVKGPGAFAITPGMTIRMALSRSGGVTDQGSEKRLTVTRKGVRQARVNIDDRIEPGDVIVVGERLF